MPQGSQVSNVQSIGDLQGLVKPNYGLKGPREKKRKKKRKKRPEEYIRLPSGVRIPRRSLGGSFGTG